MDLKEENFVDSCSNNESTFLQMDDTRYNVSEDNHENLWNTSTTIDELKKNSDVTEIRCGSSQLLSHGAFDLAETRKTGGVSLVKLQLAGSGKDLSAESSLDYDAVRMFSSHSAQKSFQDPAVPSTASISSDLLRNSNPSEGSYFSAPSVEIPEPSDFSSASNPDETPNPMAMQRFLTSDGQYVYGYKDSNGQFQLFYPTLNDRESHNEKERKRRSRVSDACSSLRSLVPGLTEKTDKATVFEQAARYLKFLRNKYGYQFDQVYCEKYFTKRS